LHQLRNIGIDVFYNVIGEAADALTIFLKGELQPGSRCEKRRPRNFGGPKEGGREKT
jgi:hypothetical protein